ncbi:unnamed protein product, partial [Rotaria magnacalcarata]
MEVDPNCLFSDVGNCGGLETPCHYFCKPPANTENHSSLLGCTTHLERLLFQSEKKKKKNKQLIDEDREEDEDEKKSDTEQTGEDNDD